MGEHLAAPEFVETADPGLNLELIARFTYISQIDRENISAVDVLDVSTSPLGLVLSGDVVG